MSVQVLQWNRKPPGELHMGPGATYPKLKYSSYYYVPPHSTWFGQLQLNCEKPLPYGWWLGAYFYYYPNYWRCQPHQWQDLVSSNGPRKFYVIISKKQLIGSQNLFKLGDISLFFFSQIVIVKFSIFSRNFNGHSFKKYQDKCFLPWWVLKAFAGRPKTLFSFFFIIPTYHNWVPKNNGRDNYWRTYGYLPVSCQFQVGHLPNERVQCPNQWVRKNPWKIRSTGSQHLEREFTNQYYLTARKECGIPCLMS